MKSRAYICVFLIDLSTNKNMLYHKKKKKEYVFYILYTDHTQTQAYYTEKMQTS